MRLKKIEVLGFKSFADRQIVLVDDHVTGVIGPNGCGKSNIVDAIRWSMGEQSAKHLRGSGMSDVIFAGCASRGPAGMAEVTLTLENEGDAPAAHFDHPEIAITRRLYADGTSEYLINKVPARLRDITELLMGTGAGTKGYSIIEQGQVGRIVSSKPEERRHIIDEAAGITRFKAQKAAAQRKIEATRQNLLRVHDVIAELEGRLGTLRRQAQKAERYKRYRTELRDLEMWIASHKFLELQSTGGVLEHRRDDLQRQVEDLRAALSTRETQIAHKRAGLEEVEAELATRQQTRVELDNRIKLLDAEDDYRTREREGLLATGAQARAELEVAGRSLDTVLTELEQVIAQRSELGDASGPEGHQSAVDRLMSELQALEGEVAKQRNVAEDARAEQGELKTEAARAEARKQSHGEAIERLQPAIAELEDELASVLQSHGEARSGHAGALERAETARVEVEKLDTERRDLDRRRIELREHVSRVEVELDTQRAEVHRCRSRLQSLEEIQKRYRGCQSGVQVVMEHRAELAPQLEAGGGTAASGGGQTEVVHGILADYVQAPEHLEAAVSAMLGDRLEGIVVDAPAVAARGVEVLKREQEGRTTFLPRRSRADALSKGDDQSLARSPEGTPLGWSSPASASKFEFVDLSGAPAPSTPQNSEGGSSAPSGDDLLDQPGVLGRLADLIEVRGELGGLTRAMLGEAVVVERLERALELWDAHRTEAPLVTLDGDRVEPTGVVVGGSPTSLNSALLQQKREIRELQEILDSLEEGFEQTRGRHLALAEELAEVERRRDGIDQELRTAERARVEAEAAVAAAHKESQRLEGSKTQLEQRIEERKRELEQRRDEIETLERTLKETSSKIERLADRITTSEEELYSATARRDSKGAELTEAKIALAQWQQQADALAAAHERLERQVTSERERITRLEQTSKSSAERVEALDEATKLGKQEREELQRRVQELSEVIEQARGRFEGYKAELEEIDASMRTLRGDLDERREKLQEVDLGLQEIALERQHLVADARDRFDVDIHEVLIEYHHRPLAAKDELARQKELKRVLARMGEVNLTAIDEFEEVGRRHEYLTSQRDDLEQAIDQLQEAIDRINKTTRDLFKETFDAVNERFQLLFPRLFGGGQASLKLTEPSDLLATGVEIEARPPGKQPRTLDLLSGGEKALTAVSLIFAIFLIKPSPFCILDEVDAPLDDANVARFCGLVRELAGSTQFIIITHNKVTMETADRLYGVTMEQRGVSKLVSVNMRRAVELAYN